MKREQKKERNLSVRLSREALRLPVTVTLVSGRLNVANGLKRKKSNGRFWKKLIFNWLTVQTIITRDLFGQRTQYKTELPQSFYPYNEASSPMFDSF
jgi:hypothetical protein